MFIFVLFKLFLSNPNSELLPIAQLIPKSTPECPTDDRNYQHIEEEQSSYSSGKYFACNKKFRKPIIVDQGLLLLYNCNFTNTRSPTSSEGIIRIIATDESLIETIEIHNCHFYKTQYGAIHIEANEANIVNCSFEKCDTDSNTIASAIYFKIKTGSIKYSNFINNNGRENDIPDIMANVVLRPTFSLSLILNLNHHHHLPHRAPIYY